MKHEIGDPLYTLEQGEFGYISDYFYDPTRKCEGYMITWLPRENKSFWLDESYIITFKHELKIYLGNIPPTSVR